MDLISHTLITRKFVGKEKSTLLAGIIADTPFYCTYPIWLARKGQLKQSFDTNEWPPPPQWMVTLHHIFHSLPIVGIIACIVFLTTSRWPKKIALAWCIHILIDIPTHSRRQWGPQFLWPISSYSFDGISWAEAAVALRKKLREAREEKAAS